jgi:hypothetical protein
MFNLAVLNLIKNTKTMKNFSKTIGAITMSLVTIGAMAQAPANRALMANHVPSFSNAKEMPTLHQTGNIKAVMTMNHIDLAYFNTDLGIVGSSAYSYFIPPAICNMRYTISDSGTTSKNYNGYHSSTVVFDTLLDAGDISYSASPGSLMVDTIFANLGYRNTSHKNDTLVFHIGSVSANGYPTGTFYTSDTVIVAPHSSALPGNDLDSIYEIYIIPNGGAGYTIPASAPKGYKFNVTIQEYGSKLDSLGTFYGAPDFQCGGGAYATYTQVGPKMGVAPHVNTIMSGYEWYDQFHGTNGQVLSWPNPNGDLYNSNGSFGNIWNIPNCGAGEDTSYIYTQDNFVAVAIDYYDNTGISKIANNGLSIGQNYPNPFNKETTIAYSLTKSSDVTFSVYDITGRVITTTNYGSVAPGQYNINLSANTFSPGIYFYTFNVNGSIVTNKMVITE